MKNFEITVNYVTYSVPTLPRTQVLGGVIETDRSKFTYVTNPSESHIVIYKEGKFLNLFLEKLDWDEIVEPLFRKHRVG